MGDQVEAWLADGASSPLLWHEDGDSDGLPDGFERSYGTSPLQADTNGDGILDGISMYGLVDPRSLDTDQDGVSNVEERLQHTNPLLSDTDGDGISDSQDWAPLDVNRGKDPLPSSTREAPDIILTKPHRAVLL